MVQTGEYVVIFYRLVHKIVDTRKARFNYKTRSCRPGVI